jgi:hypothetical protein
MDYYLGQLLDHVHWVVSDLAASQRFYPVALAPLGHEISGEGPGTFSRISYLSAKGRLPPTFTWRFKQMAPRLCSDFIRPGYRQADGTTATPVCVVTIPVTTGRICWIQTATLWKRFTMARPSGQQPLRW